MPNLGVFCSFIQFYYKTSFEIFKEEKNYKFHSPSFEAFAALKKFQGHMIDNKYWF